MITTTTAELLPGDLVLVGHGYGEAPAFVVNSGLFTRNLVVTTLTDGPGTRPMRWAPDHQVDRAPRAGEVVDGLPEYDLVVLGEVVDGLPEYDLVRNARGAA